MARVVERDAQIQGTRCLLGSREIGGKVFGQAAVAHLHHAGKRPRPVAQTLGDREGAGTGAEQIAQARHAGVGRHRDRAPAQVTAHLAVRIPLCGEATDRPGTVDLDGETLR